MPSVYEQTQSPLHFSDGYSPEEFAQGFDSTGLDAFDVDVKLEPYNYSFSSPDPGPHQFAASTGTSPKSDAKTKSKAKATKASGAAKSRQAQPSASASAASPEDGDKNQMKASERRAEQNRQAQKTFRENRKKYIKELEDKLEEAKQINNSADLLRQENHDLRSIIASLQSENEQLKKDKPHINFTWNPEGVIPNFAAVAEANGSSSLPQSSNNSPPALVPQGDSSSNETPADNSPASTAPFSSPPSTSSHDSPSPFGMSTTDPTSLPTDFFKQPQFLNPQEPVPYFLGTSDLSQQGIDWDIETLLVPVEPLSDDQLLAPNLAVPSGSEHEPMKRTLSEASFYNNTPLPFRPVTLSKDPQATRDHVETEICDLFKKIHCKDKNPELTHGTKYIKKAM